MFRTTLLPFLMTLNMILPFKGTAIIFIHLSCLTKLYCFAFLWSSGDVRFSSLIAELLSIMEWDLKMYFLTRSWHLLILASSGPGHTTDELQTQICWNLNAGTWDIKLSATGWLLNPQSIDSSAIADSFISSFSCAFEFCRSELTTHQIWKNKDLYLSYTQNLVSELVILSLNELDTNASQACSRFGFIQS